MFMIATSQPDADRAYARAVRAGRCTSLLSRLRRRCRECGGLRVVDERDLRRVATTAGRGIREIPVAAITGTLEPGRAAQFDCGFRPGPRTRSRWQRVWLAEQHGTVLPPISVVAVGAGYAVRDGHHRVSVAVARGALTIDAIVDAA